MAALIKADGQKITEEDPAFLWEEYAKDRAQDGNELSPDEMAAVSAGASPEIERYNDGDRTKLSWDERDRMYIKLASMGQLGYPMYACVSALIKDFKSHGEPLLIKAFVEKWYPKKIPTKNFRSAMKYDDLMGDR